MDAWKYAAIAAAVIIIAVLAYTSADSPAGAVVDTPTQGIQCCSFEHNGEMKTCAVPDGQSCGVCDEVCALRA